jgi:hypothetical protein
LRRTLFVALLAILALAVGSAASAIAADGGQAQVSAKKKGKKKGKAKKKCKGKGKASVSARKKGKAKKKCKGKKGKGKGKGAPKATPQPAAPAPTPPAAGDWPPAVGTYEDTSKEIIMVVSAGGTQASVALQGNDTCIPVIFQTPPAAAVATDTSFVSGSTLSIFGGNGSLKWDLEVVRGLRYTLRVDSSHHFPEQDECNKPGVVINGAFDKSP